MKITMNTSHIRSIDDLESFMQGVGKVDFSLTSKREKYQFILETLVTFKYLQVEKKSKMLIRRYLLKVTGYSNVQMKRLISKWKKGKLLSSLNYQRNKFPVKYDPGDIALLVKADKALSFPNGKSVKESLVREYEVFGNEKFENISRISVSHIYNIRKNSLQYQSATLHYTKTNSTPVSIGERRKPDNQGRPGFIRVDSVHQGDFEGAKGLYHINLVDEVTQWEVVVCVSVISNRYLIPALKRALRQFPFKVINFHSDNGSEYINHQVADMLQRLFIEQTKSRSRRSNDNALVESKNGSVIRKHMGRNHIPKDYANIVDEFYESYFNVFLNYHRICAFATDYVDKRGKIKKRYDVYLTPYEKLKKIFNVKNYLKKDISFDSLDKIAYAVSDIEFGEIMNEAKINLFKKIKIKKQF